MDQFVVVGVVVAVKHGPVDQIIGASDQLDAVLNVAPADFQVVDVAGVDAKRVSSSNPRVKCNTDVLNFLPIPEIDFANFASIWLS